MQGSRMRRAFGVLFASTTLIVAACGGTPPASTAAPKTEAKPAETKPAETKPAAPAPASPVAAAASPAASAAAPAAAASPAASPGASPSPAAAATNPTVSGDVDAVDGRVVSVATNTGVRKVRVADNASVLIEGKGTDQDLKPGAMVGITGKPDGTAVAVRLFPPGVVPKPSQFPMGGAQVGNIMTNASIVSFDGKALVVDLGGEKPTITVVPDTQIVKPVPSTFAEIKPGTRILAVGMMDGDLLAATTVTILTAPPVTRAP
jgi:hypothetical protein